MLISGYRHEEYIHYYTFITDFLYLLVVLGLNRVKNKYLPYKFFNVCWTKILIKNVYFWAI